MIFVDKVKMLVRSGKGGDGCVSFRREKYVPSGGPDGGDGGKGGDIIFRVDPSKNTLFDLRNRRHCFAENGEPGKGRNSFGKDGKDLILSVPRGTIIRDVETNKIIKDMSDSKEDYILLKGGKGGFGNQHFATPSMQAPRYAKPGKPAKERWIYLELKSIADIGLVGYPNVGKSTLLSKITAAKPKIANYHFTTLNPNLGVVDIYNDSFVIADIPGIIEGASKGIGLGHEFLKHIERNKALLHVVDIAGLEGREPLEDLRQIFEELKLYKPDLLKKPAIIAANKYEMLYDDTVLNKIKSVYEPMGIKVMPISAVTGQGIADLKRELYHLLKSLPDEKIEYESEICLEDFEEKEEAINVYREDENTFVIEGSQIDKMLGYTNLETEKGFMFFQNFLKEKGIIDKLKKLGIEEHDTVIVDYMSFEYLE